jgi:hypothetical protein
VDIGFLDNRGQRLPDPSARLEKIRKIGCPCAAWDAQLDRAGVRLPIALAITVAPVDAIRATFAMIGAGARSSNGQAAGMNHQLRRLKPTM